MKIVILIMILLGSIANIGNAQQWQTILSLDSRVGYSTNTYLNPFISEWDIAPESAFNVNSALGKTYWSKGKTSVSITGGLFYEPFFDAQTSGWKGGLGLMSINHRISNKLSIGMDGGSSYANGSFSRTLAWLQPKVTWFASPFTMLRIKAGSNFRHYENYADNLDGSERFDLYGVEFETWPSYRWQLTAGLYGSLNSLPSVQEGFNTGVTAGYHFNNGASLRLNAGLEQYQFETTTSTGGGPPGGGPPGGPTTITEINTSRIMRLGINGSVPVNEKFSVFASVEGLSSVFESGTRTDMQVSGGIRFSFEPRIGTGKNSVTPEWTVNNESQEIRVQYSGEGQLYLVGTFNDWEKPGIPLIEQSDNTYVAKLSLSFGAFEYRILRVQGNSEEWLEFSNDTYTVSDGFDSENAMILIE